MGCVRGWGGGEFCILAGPPPSFVTLGTSIALLVPQYPHLGRAGVQMDDPGTLVTQVGFSASLMLPHLSEGKDRPCWLPWNKARVGCCCVRWPKEAWALSPDPQGAGLPQA